jgi:hypothetical protein
MERLFARIVRREMPETLEPDGWDYRLVEIRTDGETWCVICEVFDRDGRPIRAHGKFRAASMGKR